MKYPSMWQYPGWRDRYIFARLICQRLSEDNKESEILKLKKDKEWYGNWKTPTTKNDVC